MEKRTVYCTACDRDVEVVLRDDHEAGAEKPDLVGAICLDIGARCTGSVCPICAVSRQKIQEEIAALEMRLNAIL
jgi:hypothetical protein